MVTIPNGYASITLVVPQHLRDSLESEVIERWGYLKRGILSDIVREALEDYLSKKDYERSKSITTVSKKNGLALFRSGEIRVNSRGLKVASDISLVLPDIKKCLQQSEDDAYYISEDNLIKILIKRLGLVEDRGQKNKIKWMTTTGLLTLWQEYKSIGFKKGGYPNEPTLVNNYFVNPEFLREEDPALT